MRKQCLGFRILQHCTFALLLLCLLLGSSRRLSLLREFSKLLGPRMVVLWLVIFAATALMAPTPQEREPTPVNSESVCSLFRERARLSATISRVDEIAADFDADPRAAYFRQMENEIGRAHV